ncbi:MFS transporter [Pseudonocardia sp. CA-107938]|uniref:MFS transporter n=1 Tax=Pseudonocardia sp. CA-107938 TaxID=3240021 RepID=UPI003D8ABC0B
MTTRQISAPASTGWLGAALAVAAVGWGANQFAPLLLLYRAELGLSAAVVNAAFGLYAVGLVPGLFVGGPLSDRYGRRPVVLAGLVASLVASVLLIVGGAEGVPWLFAGRLVAGFASGAAFSSGAAWIKELSPERAGARRATVAMTAGFAGGPLVAGVLAYAAPLPTTLPYLPHLLLILLAVAPACRARETRAVNRAAGLRIVGVTDRRFLGVVVPLAPWVFGSASVALAYLPGLVGARLGGAGLLLAALFISLGALAGIVVQPLARRIDDPGRPRRLLTAAAVSVVGGLLVAVLAAATIDTAAGVVIAMVAMVVLGAAYGVCQVCGLLEVTRLAAPDGLAGLTAVFQALSYVGFAVPYVLAELDAAAPPAVLLLGVAALAAVMLAWSTWRA